jgi:hypothetical protein
MVAMMPTAMSTVPCIDLRPVSLFRSLFVATTNIVARSHDPLAKGSTLQRLAWGSPKLGFIMVGDVTWRKVSLLLAQGFPELERSGKLVRYQLAAITVMVYVERGFGLRAQLHRILHGLVRIRSRRPTPSRTWLN